MPSNSHRETSKPFYCHTHMYEEAMKDHRNLRKPTTQEKVDEKNFHRRKQGNFREYKRN